MWDGTLWQHLGSGATDSFGTFGTSFVFCLKYWNNTLYAGGDFDTIGGVVSSHLAKWDGSIWSIVGQGITGQPWSFEVYHNKLYAAGSFLGSDSNSVNGVVEWDGNIWSNIDNGALTERFGITTFNGELYVCNYASDSNNFTMVARYTELDFQTQTTVCGACNGNASVTPVGLPPQTYNWSNGATTQTITALCQGVYAVTLTDSTGSISTGSVIIGNPFSITDTVTNASCSTCNNGSVTVTISGGIPPLSILWSNGATTATINNLLPGTYTITVTDSSGCITVHSVSVGFNVGVQQLTMENGELIIYPNPADNQLAVYSGHLAVNTIEITDLLGRVVLKQGVTPAAKKVELDISELSSGVYFIKVFSSQGAVTVKKVVKN